MCQVCDRQEERDKNPKKGDLRLWWIPQVPGKPFQWSVHSVREARSMLDMLAQYDLFQLYHHIKPDFSNAAGLEVFDGNEWTEWEDENGFEIDGSPL